MLQTRCPSVALFVPRSVTLLHQFFDVFELLCVGAHAGPFNKRPIVVGVDVFVWNSWERFETWKDVVGLEWNNRFKI